jgi:hypothetical protein
MLTKQGIIIEKDLNDRKSQWWLKNAEHLRQGRVGASTPSRTHIRS